MITLLLLCSMNPINELINSSNVASLSTNYKGTPFVSLTPFIIDDKGCPVIFASDLALHAKNLRKDEKCSLMISKLDEDDVFNSSRITFIGKMVKIKTTDEIKQKYLDKYETAKSFIDFEDFSFYRLEIEKIYWIGGFGDIEWIDLKDYQKGLPND